MKKLLVILTLSVQFAKAQTPNQKPIYWVNFGISKLFWQTKYLYGGNYQIAPNHIIGFEIYNYGEQEEGGIFSDEIPNRIKESATFKLTYGYQINPKSNYFKIIPSIGIGQTFGLYRTDKLMPNTSSGSPWFNFSSKDFEEVPFSGVSISPQIDLILHNKWLGIGIIISNNNTFEPIGFFLERWKTFSTLDFAFKLCVGKLN